MLHKKIIASLLLGALFTAGAARAQQTATDNALLDLLIKKGIITQQEADEIQKEAEAAQPPAPAVQPPAAPSAAAPAPGTPVFAVVNKGSLALQFGSTTLTPFGFLDATGVYRTTTVGSGIGTSFGSIPYSNTNGSTIGPLSETRFSAQNSRIGLRTDSSFGDVKILGYVEADFLGNNANNSTTVSNANTLRMRAYFVDVQDQQWELLAGQDWSLLTPNRKGLSPVPSDIFYTQDMDTNYQVGLVWARQPQVRLVYHPNDAIAAGISFENPDQYVGSAETLPTTDFNANQVDISAGSNSSGTTNANVLPDVIAKVALDSKLGDVPFHLEAAGITSDFKINTYAAGKVDGDATAQTFAGSVNGTLSLTPSLTLIGTSIAGSGVGRYISTGLGPDFIVAPANSDGIYQISPEHAYAGIGGAEWQAVPTSTVFAYYGLAHFNSDYFKNGSSYLGYGYPGSSNSQNKLIEEYTLGDVQTLWKDPAHGALQVISQISYLDREPFVVAAGNPTKAEATMVFLDLRYVLP